MCTSEVTSHLSGRDYIFCIGHSYLRAEISIYGKRMLGGTGGISAGSYLIVRGTAAFVSWYVK